MQLLRSLSMILLLLAMMASSVTMAQARHQPRPIGDMVLCTGYGMMVVPIDAQGQPTGPMLPCPDSILAVSALEAGAPDLPLPVLQPLNLTHALRELPAPASGGPLLPRSRAPPVAV